MSTLHIRNGRIIDPASGVDAVGDLLIAEGRIAGPGARGAPGRVLDATGLLVVPGLVDVHVHLREPGKEQAETIASGAQAALAGGFTTILAMPNTTPPLDAPERIAWVRERARAAGGARVEVAACITRGRAGRDLVDFGALAEADAVAFTDDGSAVADADLMWLALKLTDLCGRPILQHAEDPLLSAGGVIHAGAAAADLGLPGMPAEAEAVMVARDLALAQLTGARVHFQHVSTAQAVDLLRRAKRKGVRVTAEACPHHFALTDESCRGGDGNFKMNPPLRTEEDVAAVKEGLRDGTIDCIASDHAPHPPAEKAHGLRDAPFGVIGLETTVPIVWRELVEPGLLTAAQAVALLTCRPAAVLGLDDGRGTLRPGAPADVTLLDARAEWTIDPARFRSRSRNCPFAGWRVRARAVAVLREGELVFDSRSAGA